MEIFTYNNFLFFNFRRECIADMVPVDIPINLMCAVAWRLANFPLTSSIPVYNCTSGSLNPMKWGEMEAWGFDSLVRYPLDNALWYPGGAFKDTHMANVICQVKIKNARIR